MRSRTSPFPRWLLVLCLLAVGSACPPISSAQSPVSGDWQGSLVVGGNTLHIALHITGSGSSLRATLDSIDQNAFGIPVSTVAFAGHTLTFRVEGLRASYAGKLSDDAAALTGTFTQAGTALPLNFAKLSADGPARADKPIDGTWSGAFVLPAGNLPIVFHFKSAGGKLSGTLDSPQQGVTGVAFTELSRAGSTLHLAVSSPNATFDGSFTPDLQTLTGTWTQGGSSLPLKLTRAAPGAAPMAQSETPRRPQTPMPPFPYRAVDVSYLNTKQGDTLAGTLTIPPGKGPFPSVLLITGSGAQDRDESLMGHKPFLVLADFLSRHGIVVLRVDDRGTGKSTGNFAAATTADFATDTEAGVAFLRTRTEVDPHRIGLIGHSEGGLIAPMVAARDPGIAFLVLLAGPGVPGDQIIPEQQRLILQASGLPEEQTKQSVALERQLLAADEQPATPAEREAKLRTLLAASQPGATPEQLAPLVKQLTSPWFLSFLALDPGAYLKQVHCPVLALDGSLDLQVPPRQNLDAIAAALKAGGNGAVTVHEFPGLNHLFQPAATGSPTEYGSIETTMDPSVLETVATWISAR